MAFIQNQFERNFLTTSVDYVFNWARKSAIWPLTFGLACCAIEMIASSTSRFDIEHRHSPGHCSRPVTTTSIWRCREMRSSMLPRTITRSGTRPDS